MSSKCSRKLIKQAYVIQATADLPQPRNHSIVTRLFPMPEGEVWA